MTERQSTWESRFERRPARTILRAGLAGLLILFVLSIVGWGMGVLSLPFRAASGVIERTLNPDSMIYNYEWFKRQYNDVLAMDGKIRTADSALKALIESAGPRPSWRHEEITEWSRLSSIANGLKAQRYDMVAAYNARASMANRSIFMGTDVPSSIQ